MGLLAALLAAIYPAFIDNSEQFLSEPIAAFTLVGARCSAFLWAARPGPPAVGLAGAGRAARRDRARRGPST